MQHGQDPLDPAAYKLLKEQFVQDLHGTSHAEVFMLAQCMPLLMCLGNAVRLWLGPQLVPAKSVRHFLLEAAFVLLPLVAVCMGPLAPATWFWTLAALYGCIVLLPLIHMAVQRRGSTAAITCQQAAGALNLGSVRRVYLTQFRGGLMLYTCVCILAVDFHAFPRRFAKAEVFGTGLMDVGVGGIIVASGLVAGGGAPRGQSVGGSQAAGGAGWGPLVGLARRATRGMQSALPSLVLGGARLVSVKLLGYQEHIGEYGAHWNFFCTIAVVTLLSHLVPVPPARRAWAALLVTCAHQALLSSGLGAWALSPERGPDLISLNKEGLVSVPGYWALSLAGGALSHALHTSCQAPLAGLRQAVAAAAAAAARAGQERQQDGPGQGEVAAAAAAKALPRREREPLGQATKPGSSSDVAAPQQPTAAANATVPARLLLPVLLWLLRWACLDAALWAGLLALEARVERRSRRSCNAAYVAWTAALSLSLLLPVAAAQVAWTLLRPPSSRQQAVAATPSGRVKVDKQGKGDPDVEAARCQPWLPAACSRAMLPVFLAANLMTGAVNMGVDTLAVPDLQAGAIVGAYLCAVGVFAAALDVWDVKVGV